MAKGEERWLGGLLQGESRGSKGCVQGHNRALRLGVQQRSTPRIWLSTSTDLRELQSKLILEGNQF